MQSLFCNFSCCTFFLSFCSISIQPIILSVMFLSFSCKPFLRHLLLTSVHCFHFIAARGIIARATVVCDTIEAHPNRHGVEDSPKMHTAVRLYIFFTCSCAKNLNSKLISFHSIRSHKMFVVAEAEL